MVTGQFKILIEKIFSIADKNHIDPDQSQRIRELLYDVEGLSILDNREHILAEFWARAKSTQWITYFWNEIKDCPNVVEQNGNFKIPLWPPQTYLKLVAKQETCKVEELLSQISTNNPKYYELLCDLIIKNLISVRDIFINKLIEYLNSPYLFTFTKIDEVLFRLTSLKDLHFALYLAKKCIEFKLDPKTNEKQAQRKSSSENMFTSLEPQPIFDQWRYQEILEKGIRPLAEKAPLEMAFILIDVVASMIRLRIHQDELEKISNNDFSYIWCQRLDEPTRDHLDSKEALVHTLTYACEKVYEKKPASVVQLNEALRKGLWNIFQRIREHLYATNLTEQTKPWIREIILEHRDYDKSVHHYEFQRMVRLACEKFGSKLLSEGERETIFEAIKSGPSKESWKEFVGDNYTEERFIERKSFFHRSQLTPFSSVLFGRYKVCYQKLCKEASKPIDDDSYSPCKSEGVKTGEYQSPKSADELSNMADKDLLNFLNVWEDVHHEPGKWWVDINFEALSFAFQMTFKNKIIPNNNRLRFWMDSISRIERPIYVRAMLLAILELVKDKNFDHLKEWFDLCDWILIQPDTSKQDDEKFSDDSKEYPSWQSARRTVGDYVGECIDKKINIPISSRARLAKVLEKLCTNYDRILDDDEIAYLDRNDQLNKAINNTRSRALENLVEFGYWVRRHEGDKIEVPEVFFVLDTRMTSGPPLTLPEHAILGMQFGRLYDLDLDWAKNNKKWIFPQDNFKAWVEAIGPLLQYNKPHRQTFELFKNDFEFALKNIAHLISENQKRRELADILAEHLFTYYVWDVFPLEGDDSLLQRYYDNTKDDPQRWAALFDHIGRSLKNSGKHLKKSLKSRIIKFFDWRYEQKNGIELAEFTFWLKAECLDAKWRLESFSKTLDVRVAKDVGVTIRLEAIYDILDEYPDLVVECFAKMIDSEAKERLIFIKPDHAIPILLIGLRSENEIVRQNAESARENLLRAGRFEFLDVEKEDK